MTSKASAPFSVAVAVAVFITKVLRCGLLANHPNNKMFRNHQQKGRRRPSMLTRVGSSTRDMLDFQVKTDIREERPPESQHLEKGRMKRGTSLDSTVTGMMSDNSQSSAGRPPRLSRHVSEDMASYRVTKARSRMKPQGLRADLNIEPRPPARRASLKEPPGRSVSRYSSMPATNHRDCLRPKKLSQKGRTHEDGYGDSEQIRAPPQRKSCFSGDDQIRKWVLDSEKRNATPPKRNTSDREHKVTFRSEETSVSEDASAIVSMVGALVNARRTSRNSDSNGDSVSSLGFGTFSPASPKRVISRNATTSLVSMMNTCSKSEHTDTIPQTAPPPRLTRPRTLPIPVAPSATENEGIQQRLIPVEHGVSLPLRGTQETMKALTRDEVTHAESNGDSMSSLGLGSSSPASPKRVISRNATTSLVNMMNTYSKGAHFDTISPPRLTRSRTLPDFSAVPSATENEGIQQLLIPIEYGVSLPLRGTQETMKALARDELIHTECTACETFLHCIKTVEFVLCPVCRGIGKVPNAPVGQERCIGMGLTVEDIMQSHLNSSVRVVA